VLRALVALAGVVVLWAWWQTGRRNLAPELSRPAGNPAGPAAATGDATTTGHPQGNRLRVPAEGRRPGFAAQTVPSDTVPKSLEPLELIPVERPLQPRATNAVSALGSGDGVIEAQAALARLGISPGSIDGRIGPQTRAAIRAFQLWDGLPVTGQLDEATTNRLRLDTPLFDRYEITGSDLARLLPLGATWLAKSQQPRLDYETILELVAEKSRAHPDLIRRINPDTDWDHLVPGANVRILRVEGPLANGKAACLRIRLADRTLQAFDAQTNLLAHFPCSIARRVEKRPAGETLRVAVLAPDPNYTFDPEVFPESAEGRELGRKLILQPGPNNPVGTVWIGLDKPGYGIHGTPRPEEVGRTESHGCFRLANWNAEHLLRLVSIGTPVHVDP
jgi:lipoprotein-anchoring transpeptidase ErfK/SrfK